MITQGIVYLLLDLRLMFGVLGHVHEEPREGATSGIHATENARIHLNGTGKFTREYNCHVSQTGRKLSQ